MTYPVVRDFHTDMISEARTILDHIKENFPELRENELRLQQALCLAEESGEYVGALRRWAGFARRSGDRREMASELADVLITVYVNAAMNNVNLRDAVDAKLIAIHSRGWRDNV